MIQNCVLTERIAQFYDVISGINVVEIVTPQNFAAEKKKWVANVVESGNFGNPEFTYDREKLAKIAGRHDEFEKLYAYLSENIDWGTDPAGKVLKQIFEKRCEAIRNCIALATSILNGDSGIIETSKKLFPAPRQEYVDLAYEVSRLNAIISSPNGSKSAKRKAQQRLNQILPYHAVESTVSRKIKKSLTEQYALATNIHSCFNHALEHMGINWTTSIRNDVSAIDVRDFSSLGESVIVIPERKKVTNLKLLEYCGHEIGSHVRGSMNSRALINGLINKNSPVRALIPFLAKCHDESFYEGVAKIADVRVNDKYSPDGGLNRVPNPYYIIATDLASRGNTFAETASAIYAILTSGFEFCDDSEVKHFASKAWTYTYRIFRGTNNPASQQGYCFMKDCGYLIGYLDAMEVPANWQHFSSLSIEEVFSLSRVNADLDHPAYPDSEVEDFAFSRM